MTREQYIRAYRKLVIEATEGTGLFPSVMMAQAVLESANGQSQLAYLYNNHFGIKANSSWNGKRVNLQTREVMSGRNITIGDYFRVYDSVGDSFKDRNRFLAENSRYHEAGVFNAPTPEHQAYALQRARYATDPNYAQILISLIKDYNLKSLDIEQRNGRLRRLGIGSLCLTLTAAGIYYLHSTNMDFHLPNLIVKR